MIMIYTTYPDEKIAKKIIEQLLKDQLIVCANLFPVDSYYRWEGKIEADNEAVAILKTSAENWPLVKREIMKVHPHEVPCIIRINAEANKLFGEWLSHELEN